MNTNTACVVTAQHAQQLPMCGNGIPCAWFTCTFHE